MRDINRAERLLALFTAPESAAGIVGDLSEERSQHGKVWFWRQVVGTVLSLCRGALFESPVVVLLLVALGFVLSAVVSSLTTLSGIYLFHLRPDGSNELILVLIFKLLSWPGKLLAGATMVAAAPRLGMAACALLGGFEVLLSLYLFSHTFPYQGPHFFWLIRVTDLAYPVLLLLGGAMIRRLWNARRLRAAT